jgi:aryl-alcohol dehydrogenase-like predicted oxidoreductase
VGAALRYLSEVRGINRQELFVASKVGYIPEDADKGIDTEKMLEDLLKNKVIGSPEEIVSNVHCMGPGFIKNQVKASLRNLQLETVDLVYLHNAAESQLGLIGEAKFLEKLAKAFEAFEELAEEKKIRSYGLATWLCFRSSPDNERRHLSLEKVVKVAQQVAGDKHRFTSVQMPMSLLMPEGFVQKWQSVGGKMEYMLSAARLLRVGVFTSAPFVQGSMLQVPLSSELLQCSSQGAKHLQLIRSLPAESIVSTLVGMKRSRHVKQNLELIYENPIKVEDFWEFMTPKIREDDEEIRRSLNEV